MPLYSYKAIDAGGKSVAGRLDALNLFDLEQRLSRMELDLVAGAPATRSSSMRERRCSRSNRFSASSRPATLFPPASIAL